MRAVLREQVGVSRPQYGSQVELQIRIILGIIAV